MKVAEKVVLLLKDGVSAAVTTALHPNPGANYEKRSESFALPLDYYGIKDQKACGEIIHYVSSDGRYVVSILILQKYEPPILACAVNEVLLTLSGDDSSTPSLIVPFLVPESKLKQDNKHSIKSGNTSVYGIELGPSTNVTEALISKLRKPTPLTQIYDEELTLLHQFLKVMNLPSVLLIAQISQQMASKDDLEVICEMGSLLASITSLAFSKEKMIQNPIKISKDSKEAWRALYG